MTDCNCCNWDTPTEIIQGDVTIENLTAAGNASYIADFAMRREVDGSLPYSAQGMCTFEHYAVFAWINADESQNTMAIMDLETQIITDVVSDFLPAGHLNSMCTKQKEGSLYYEVYVADGYTLKTFNVSNTGKFIAGSVRTYTSTVSFGGICYNNDDLYLIGHSAATFYRLRIVNNMVETDLIFDGKPAIERMYNWVYPGWETHPQSCTYRDGVLYSIWSHPNAIFKFSLNGHFLGCESVPYTVDGHPCAEIEDIDYNPVYKCFFINVQGRTNDDYEPSHYIWGRSFLFAWGGYAARNWRLEYSSNDGSPNNVHAGSLKNIYAVANRPNALPTIGDYCRHTGIIGEPFNFIVDAVYMSDYLENNSGRDEVHLYLSGNFAAYENGSYNNLTDSGSGISLSGNLRVVINANNTYLPRFNIANGATIDFLPNTGVDRTSCRIERINCSRNSTVNCTCHCGNIAVGTGAKFAGNTLGSVVLKADSLSIVLLGNTDITLLSGSSKTYGSLFMANSGLNLTALSTSSSGDVMRIVKAVVD